MFDINEIRKRAQQAGEQAADAIKETFEKSEDIIKKIETPDSEKSPSISAAEVEEQLAAHTQRQVEILGQMFGQNPMDQMAVNEEMLQKMVNDKVSEAAASATENFMGQLFGEDAGILAAALETLEMEDAANEEALSSDPEPEESLYAALEDIMARLEAMPEPEAVPYQKEDVKWERFGILLSGILSTLNSHNLSEMDVEAHIPVMEQKIVSLVRRSWGINGRSDLLDMIRYLAQEGYILRYQLYSQASSPEELHSWRQFAQSYLFGGLMWKLLCGDRSAESYLGYLADAAADLLTGKSEEGSSQWRDCPWPAKRKIGFTI